MKKKFLLLIFLSIVVLSCEKADPAAPQPSLEIESPISSIVEASRYEGQPGDVLEFTVKANAPAGFKSFVILLEQRTSGSFMSNDLIILDSNSPGVMNNSLEYTFSRELTPDDFNRTDNFMRAILTDVKDKTATKSVRLVEN